jgi:hypothetical protein
MFVPTGVSASASEAAQQRSPRKSTRCTHIGPSRHIAPPLDLGRERGIAEIERPASVAEGDAHRARATSTWDDFAMLRLILLALLPQIGGILLLVGRQR